MSSIVEVVAALREIAEGLPLALLNKADDDMRDAATVMAEVGQGSTSQNCLKPSPPMHGRRVRFGSCHERWFRYEPSFAQRIEHARRSLPDEVRGAQTQGRWLGPGEDMTIVRSRKGYRWHSADSRRVGWNSGELPRKGQSMSTMTAHWSAPVRGTRGAGGRRTVRSAADVDELLAAITDYPAEAAIIYHEARPMVQLPEIDDGDFPDHTVEIAVRDGWGYMRMSIKGDGDCWWIIDGDPASPAYVQGESEFPAGSRVPVSEVAVALKEFLRTAHRPMSLRWAEDV
jgi:hypothetical protein